MKTIIKSIVFVLFISIATICASYYFVTKYNIDKDNAKKIESMRIYE